MIGTGCRNVLVAVIPVVPVPWQDKGQVLVERGLGDADAAGGDIDAAELQPGHDHGECACHRVTSFAGRRATQL